jgi:hypothetical protein
VMVAIGIFAIVALVLVIIAAVISKIRSPGYMCELGHWQNDGAYCADCGRPTVYYKRNPKCSNGHKRETKDHFCWVCGISLIKKGPKSAG